MSESLSLAESLALLPPDECAATIAAMNDEKLLELRFEWQFWRRPEQTPPPDDWRVWLIPGTTLVIGPAPAWMRKPSNRL
jgi:hypothetical protein